MSWVFTLIALVACASTPAGTNSTSSNGADADTESDASGDGDADAGTTDADTSTDDGASDDGADGCSDGWGCYPDMMVFPMCNPLDQDCPDGEKCAPVVLDPVSGAWDANVCVPEGDQPIGAPCTFVEGGVNGQDTCAGPGYCWAPDPDTGIGQCVEQCSGDPGALGCPISGLECYERGSSVLFLCLPTCDPLADPCWEGTICIAFYGGDAEVPEGFFCGGPGTLMPGGPGDPCGCANCCQTGTLCEDPNSVGLDNCPDVDPATQFCCTALCDINLPDPDLPCAEAGLVGTVCVALTPPGTPEPLGKVGKCVLP